MCRRHQNSLTSGGGDVQSGKTVAISCFVRLHDPLLFFKGALIDSEKPFLPKAKSSKIKTLDSRLCGNNDFFSVSLNCTVWPGFVVPIKQQSNDSIIIEAMDASLASPMHLALYCLLRAQPAYTACAHTLAQALGQPFTEIAPALAAMLRQGLLLQHADGPVTRYCKPGHTRLRSATRLIAWRVLRRCRPVRRCWLTLLRAVRSRG